MNGKACISLNMSAAVIACLSDFFFFFPPHSFCCFWCLKMCRQRKVNTDIVPPNKRASPCISKRCLCGGVFSSGGLLGIALTLPRTCVRTCTRASMRVCVCKVCECGGGGRRRRKGGGVQVRLCGYPATEGTVYRGTRILTTLSVVFLSVGAQIFFQPSTVSTERTFFD